MTGVQTCALPIFLVLNASQNLIRLKVLDYNLKTKTFMVVPDKNTMIFLSYLKYFLDSITFFIKDREENPIIFSEEDEICLDF